MSSLYDICWMGVEPRYAAEVQELLQSLRARDGVGADGPAGGPVTTEVDAAGAGGGRRRNNGGGVMWSDDEYRAFMSADKESYRRVRAFCDVLADEPGEAMTTTRVSAAAEITPTQLRAALGKFSVWMGATISNREWPFGWAYGDDVDPDNPAEFHYVMTEDQARAWKAHRQDLP